MANHGTAHRSYAVQSADTRHFSSSPVLDTQRCQRTANPGGPRCKFNNLRRSVRECVFAALVPREIHTASFDWSIRSTSSRCWVGPHFRPQRDGDWTYQRQPASEQLQFILWTKTLYGYALDRQKERERQARLTMDVACYATLESRGCWSHSRDTLMGKEVDPLSTTAAAAAHSRTAGETGLRNK